MILITTFCIFYNRIPILYFFSHYLLLNISSSKLFFSHISQFFWTLWELSFLWACNFCFPFIILNFGIFFLSSLTRYEWKLFVKWFFFFLGCFFMNFMLIYKVIIPIFLKFFLSFEQENVFFALHLEVKFEEYFFMLLKTIFFLEILLLAPFFLSFLIFFNSLPVNFFLQNKNILYICFIILSLVISPPDFFIQSSFILLIIFLIETFFWFFFFWKYFKLNLKAW